MQLINDLLALLPTIELLDDAFVDRLTLTANASRNLEQLTLPFGHAEELLGEGFEKLDRAPACFDVVVVIVSFFFDLVQSLLVEVLPVGDEPGVFGRPGRVRCPVIVEDFVAKLITATAWLEALL